MTAIVLETPTYDMHEEGITYCWENATASVIGQAAKPGNITTGYPEGCGCDVATANTDFPVGVVASVASQYEGVKLLNEGIVPAIAGGAIAVGDLVIPTTSGHFIKKAPTAVPFAAVYWIWGRAESAATTGNLFSLRFQPMNILQHA